MDKPFQRNQRSRQNTIKLNPVSFKTISLNDATEYKYKPVWQRALFRLKVKWCINSLFSDVVLYGTKPDWSSIKRKTLTKNDNDLIKNNEKFEEQNLEKDLLHEENLAWYQISPHSNFKKFWTTVISLLIIYTITILPWRLAFEEPDYLDPWAIFEYCLDCIFLIDIVINLFSCDLDNCGFINPSFTSNLYRYLLSWFILDLTASIPLSLFEFIIYHSQSKANSHYNSMLKLAKIPKIAKLMKLAKVIKAFRIYKQNGILERLQDSFHINARIIKILKFFATLCVSIHIMGCLWFYTAKLNDFDYTTWVARYGFIDKNSLDQYLASSYWAFYTLVTVGYGDILPGNQLEVRVVMLWIMIGVCLYSFALGSLSTFISGVATKESLLASKLAAVHEFAKESGISKECKQKIRNAIRYNIYSGHIWNDKHTLFNDIPKSLKYEVAMTMYNGIVNKIRFFEDKDQSFIISIMPMMRPMQGIENSFLYKEDAYADEMYFITRGRVNMVLSKNDIAYKSFLYGSYIGEIEILLQLSRISNAQVCGASEFLIIEKKDLLIVLEEFPDIFYEMSQIATERVIRIKNSKSELETIIEINSKKGNLSHLSGKSADFVLHEPKPIVLDENARKYVLYEQLKEQKKVVEEMWTSIESTSNLCSKIFATIIQVADAAQEDMAKGVGFSDSKVNLNRVILPKLDLNFNK